MGQARGYDAVFGFALIQGRPFYFFEQDDSVHISYDAQTLPDVYDEVFHGQCCEAAMHNVEAGEDVVWFYALQSGTWYSVVISGTDCVSATTVPVAQPPSSSMATVPL